MQPLPNKVTEEQVKAALTIILSDKTAYPTTLNWAVRYVEAATQQSGNSLKIQCLYVLNNISYWRHPQASLVRQVLKAFAKDAKPPKDMPKLFAPMAKEVLCKQRTSHLFLKPRKETT